MADLLLPRTDAGALVQVVVAAAVLIPVAVVVRRQRDLLVFVAGVGVALAAFFALRTVH